MFSMYIFIIINVQEESTMKVNTTELRRHLSDYLAMANKEEIIITRNRDCTYYFSKAGKEKLIK